MRPLRALALAAATLLAGALLNGGVAAAHYDACTGLGVLSSKAPMYYSGFGGPTVTEFTLSFPSSAGFCVESQSQVLTGSLTGHCGLATAAGNYSDHPFLGNWAGNSIAVRGGIVGELKIVSGIDRCTSGATEWVVQGQLAFHHGGTA